MEDLELRELRGGGGGKGASSSSSDRGSSSLGHLGVDIVLRNISAEVEKWNEEFLESGKFIKKLYEPVIGIIIFSITLYLISFGYEKY